MLLRGKCCSCSFFIKILFSYWIHSYSVWAATVQDLVILDQLLKKGYDRRATPTNHLNNSTPTLVYCELFVRSFGSPNPMTMDYKVDLYLRQKWTDSRLQHEELREPMDLNDPNLVKAIWKPEVYFPNSKDADFQFVTVPNVLIRIHPGGEILYMLRLKMSFSCMMDLSKFPLDKQNCTIEVASFSKTVEELILEWKPHLPVTTGNLGMSQFELDGIRTDKCQESFQIGNYSCLVAEFHLSRSLGFHLVQSYLPTILMVAISWVSFWMDVNSVPGRVTLGVTTLLTVSSKATNVQESLVQTSYIKAIDLWMSSCTAFVFLALLEFTIVNYLWRKECTQSCVRARKNEKCRIAIERRRIGKSSSSGGGVGVGELVDICEQPISNSGSCNTLEKRIRVKEEKSIGMTSSAEITGDGPIHFHTLMTNRDGNSHIGNPESRNLARKIDVYARLMFPFGFFVFNICYWSFYLT